MEAARVLFWDQGYHATSLAEIAARAGVHNGSLYYFFRTKDDLLVAVLERYLEILRPVLMDPLNESVTDPLERIFGLLEGYRTGLEMSGFTKGCPIGNLALEVGDTHPAARAKIAENFSGWQQCIRQWLDQLDDRLAPDVDRAGVAQFVLTVMEGAVMQARIYRTLAPFDGAVAQLRRYFNQMLREGA